MNPVRLTLVALAATTMIISSSQAQTTNYTVTVPAIANIWLGGVDASVNIGGDTLANAAPVALSNSLVVPFAMGTFQFGAVGSWKNDPFAPSPFSPLGTDPIINVAITNTGFGAFQTKAMGLIGVFTDNTPWTARVVPSPSTVFPYTQSVHVTALNRPFYIGNGTNSAGSQITFVPPAGARNLYLGCNDSATYNNTGSLSVKVTATPTRLQIQRAVYLTHGNLLLGTNYQLQVAASLGAWTNWGPPFTATSTVWRTTNYWDVDQWNSLNFRLQQQ